MGQHGITKDNDTLHFENKNYVITILIQKLLDVINKLKRIIYFFIFYSGYNNFYHQRIQ